MRLLPDFPRFATIFFADISLPIFRLLIACFADSPSL